ncbi:protein FATTY ACID EXPORT 4, chloroplastic-like isoform X1 [Gossypium australe]|uniref:Protein FATTY ACID EXPORT 4, chloroplastic-like isoform X1 n=1 Tax=Gossypium australe TaxID=47621 RepID=A0A5B6UFV3_9ROSI|nr:protein FATTY ACID EXPORT 4, chloroplastic-like isoform X1 [Gossypium australe]
MMLATPIIQMPTITAVKAVSFSNPNQQPFIRPHLVGFCLRKPKLPSTTRATLFCCNSQLQDFAPLTSAAYGTLLFSGGLFAFTKSGSKGSLFGSLTGAALMASAYYLMQSTETKAIGDALGFGSAFLFSSVFAYVVTTIGIRLAATRKPIPAGPLLGLSICALVVFTSAYLQDRL